MSAEQLALFTAELQNIGAALVAQSAAAATAQGAALVAQVSSVRKSSRRR